MESEHGWNALGLIGQALVELSQIPGAIRAGGKTASKPGGAGNGNFDFTPRSGPQARGRPAGAHKPAKASGTATPVATGTR